MVVWRWEAREAGSGRAAANHELVLDPVGMEAAAVGDESEAVVERESVGLGAEKDGRGTYLVRGIEQKTHHEGTDAETAILR